MKRFFYLLAVASTVVLFTSCQKSNDIISNQQNIEGTWAINGISSDRSYDFNGDGRVETDIYGSYSYCGRDIVLVFTANGYGQIRQGCNAAWQNISWRFTNDNRTLNISLPDDELNLELQQFDDYTLRGNDRVFINGTSFTIAYTFQRR